MSDEPIPAAATAEPTAPVEEPAGDQPAAAPAAPERDWDALLNEAPDDILARHRRVQGIAGSHAERLYQRRQQESEAERLAEAQRKAREDLRTLARDRPLEFADMFISHDDAEQARERILTVERSTAKQLMEQIGDSFKGLPEWTDLTDTEKAKLREAVNGASDNDVLPRFNKAALDIVADRRAARLLTDRLPAEREAWRKEQEAERLAKQQSPDLRRPSSTTPRRIDFASMSDEDFNKWYRQRYGR